MRASAPVIYAAVRRSLRVRGIPTSETPDRVQDVYVRLFRDECKLLRTFDPKRASLVTWLTLIARTVVHEQARRKTLPVLRIDGREATLPDHAKTSAATTGDASSLGELPLNLLSGQQRQVIEMLFQQGLSVEEAAQRLGVEEQTIRSAKHKALTRLREHLSGHISGEKPPERNNKSGGYASGGAARTQETDDAAR